MKTPGITFEPIWEVESLRIVGAGLKKISSPGMKTLATLLLGADERRPTEQKLSWQLAASKGDWESYDKAHFAHLAMLEADQEAIQQEEYDVQYEMIHQLMEETEDLLEARRGAEVDVQYGIEKQ